ncbi:MAG: hypothetical protein M3Y08_02970 [Fibrobacterota bacterium]|nr:hypothetical protein [Fibrobacterota bacterium]
MQKTIPHTTLKTLYDIAQEVLRLAPWSYMKEDETFSLQAGPDGEIFYACVIGRAGISRGIVYYRGARGWDAYERVSNGTMTPEDAIQELDTLNADFEPWKNIDPDSKKRLKRLGFGPGSELLPSPLVYSPGKAPAPPNATDAETLIQLLRASMPVFRRSALDPKWLLEGPDDKLFRVLPGGDGENPAGEWLPLPEPSKPTHEAAPPDELMLARLKGKRLAPCRPWEVLVADSGATVKEGKGAGAYFPLVMVLADSTTGFVAGFTLVPAAEMAEALPRECLKAMQTHGAQPEAFHVNREDVAAWLEPVARKMGIPVLRKGSLPMAAEAHRSLREFLGKKR